MKLLPIFSLMALSAFACSANAADNHSNIINVKTGSQFTIELKSNPTTGYSWILRKLPDNVAYVGSQYDEDSTCQSKKLLGCGGKHILIPSEGIYEIIGQPYISGLYCLYTNSKGLLSYKPISIQEKHSLINAFNKGVNYKDALIRIGKNDLY